MNKSNKSHIDIIDHIFRHEYGNIVSALTSKYSFNNIDLIEDAVQDALLKAMDYFSFKPIPQNITGWLYKTAQNRLIDNLRRSKKYDLENEFSSYEKLSHSEISINENIEDDLLKMIFTCCHPTLNPVEQIMLSLKLLCGLSIKEIANGLMKSEDAVKKAITRSKQKFKESVSTLEVPSTSEIDERLNSVIQVLYLMFNEGYKATSGNDLLKKEISFEAIRLAEVLLKVNIGNKEIIYAVLSLMYFNASRFDTRIDSEGKLVTLKDQDRAKWNLQFITNGFAHLEQCGQSDLITTYHIQAAIASLYISVNTFEETDWQSILKLYDALLKIDYSQSAALSRIVVLEKVEGSEKALEELKYLEGTINFSKDYLFHSVKAELFINSGNNKKAEKELLYALALIENKIEEEFIEEKIKSLT